MEYGQIIKRAWRITWRYKALWVLGLFAGISGCSGNGGGSRGGGSRAGSTTDFGNITRDGFRFGSMQPEVDRYLPVLIAIGLLMIGLALLWAILALAARGGLVIGVDEAERGAPRRLGQLWSIGFHRFWPLVGLDILLKWPVFLAVMLLIAAIAVPFIVSMAGAGDVSPGVVVPVCGVLAIGLPVVVIGSIVLDVLYLIALRYLMLGGYGVFESASNAWRFFRARFKDSAQMYLINGGLNIAASLVLAVPAVFIGIAVAIPLVGGFATERWGVMIWPIVLLVLTLMALVYLYTAVWGTFTSALWTLFFRDAMNPAQPAAEEPAPVQPADPWLTQAAPPAEAAPEPSAPSETAPELSAPPAPPASSQEPHV